MTTQTRCRLDSLTICLRKLGEDENEQAPQKKSKGSEYFDSKLAKAGITFPIFYRRLFAMKRRLLAAE
jgi:hypothetical protein